MNPVGTALGLVAARGGLNRQGGYPFQPISQGQYFLSSVTSPSEVFWRILVHSSLTDNIFTHISLFRILFGPFGIADELKYCCRIPWDRSWEGHSMELVLGWVGFENDHFFRLIHFETADHLFEMSFVPFVRTISGSRQAPAGGRTVSQFCCGH